MGKPKEQNKFSGQYRHAFELSVYYNIIVVVIDYTRFSGLYIIIHN